jgi:hypothetical protein
VEVLDAVVAEVLDAEVVVGVGVVDFTKQRQSTHDEPPPARPGSNQRRQLELVLTEYPKQPISAEHNCAQLAAPTPP